VTYRTDKEMVDGAIAWLKRFGDSAEVYGYTRRMEGHSASEALVVLEEATALYGQAYQVLDLALQERAETTAVDLAACEADGRRYYNQAGGQ